MSVAALRPGQKGIELEGCAPLPVALSLKLMPVAPGPGPRPIGRGSALTRDLNGPALAAAAGEKARPGPPS